MTKFPFNTEFGTVSAVIFDMDGLLLDTEPLYYLAWSAAFRRCDLEMTKEMHRSLLGRGRKAALEMVVSHHAQSNVSTEMLNQALEEEEQKIFSANIPNLKLGALEILNAFRAANCPMALATSTGEKMALPRIKQAGIEVFFQKIVTGNMVKKGKPDPEIFLLAASQINAIPVECMVLEDSEAGIQAAASGGMIGVMVPDLKQPSEEIRKLASWVAGSLVEVRERIFGVC